MANAYMFQFRMGYEQKPVSVFVKVTFGASGAPTLSVPGSKGVTSITQNGTGDYTLQFKSNYNRLLAMKHIINSGSAAPAGGAMYLKSESIAGNGQIRFVTNASGTAANPASGEIYYFEFVFANSGY